MKEFFKNNYKLLLILFISFILFLPSLFVFYTNDDFFFLKISNVSNIAGILNFFNFIKGPDGFGMYRPLTTQIFYFLAWRLFNLNPLGLHIISFLTFFVIVYLIYIFALDLFHNKKIALVSAFLYATSATHFAHLYYLSTFQELGVTLCVLLSCLSFLKYLKVGDLKNWLLSFSFFILSLLSKETGVVTPLLLLLIYLFKRREHESLIRLKKMALAILPFVISLALYFIIRFSTYGFASGDTYIWDFSIKRLANTIVWYFVWSLNIPETLVDFVGPGLVVNPNLWLYWSKEILPILILFGLECLFLVSFLFKVLLVKNKNEKMKINSVSIFCIVWFLITLAPVVFLPFHKFTFYLTLPLIGITFRIAYLFVESKFSNLVLFIFLTIWTIMSFLTLNHTANTNWITQGEKISKHIYIFFNTNQINMKGKEIIFSDTQKDVTLPWSPTNVIKVAISGENFFKVFYPELTNQIVFGYNKNIIVDKSYIITSRTFLGY